MNLNLKLLRIRAPAHNSAHELRAEFSPSGGKRQNFSQVCDFNKRAQKRETRRRVRLCFCDSLYIESFENIIKPNARWLVTLLILSPFCPFFYLREHHKCFVHDSVIKLVFVNFFHLRNLRGYRKYFLFLVSEDIYLHQNKKQQIMSRWESTIV